MNAEKKIWIKVWSALAVVFALGCIAGIAISGVYRSRIDAAQSVSLRDADAYFETLARELDLNPEQSAAIRSILEETRSEYKKVCAEVRPRYDALRQQARSRMRAMLTAAQQQRFDSIVLQEDCNTCPDRKK
jgi:flagellar biosynthesis GTPase FlhF